VCSSDLRAFVAACERYFGDAPAVRRGFERVAPPPLVEPFEKVAARGRNHQSHCILGRRAYSLSDERRVPLSLLVNLLGGPAANSRLNSVLRERNGLTYNIDAGYVPYSDTGFANVCFSCERDNIERCRELVDVELERVMSSPLTARALSMAKKQFVGQFAISMDSDEGYMLGAAKSMLIYNEIDSPQTVVRKVGEITAEQVMEVARDAFGGVSTLIYR
jgi:predicted Zn-dependent peptidase